jgi:hypothetical protein
VLVVCFSDNGPCYSASAFQRFAMSYGFIHQTSSPRFAQSNGAAEGSTNNEGSAAEISRLSPGSAVVPYDAAEQRLLTGTAADGQAATLHRAHDYGAATTIHTRRRRSTVLRPHLQQQQATYYIKYNRRHRTHDRGRWKTSDRVWTPTYRRKPPS